MITSQRIEKETARRYGKGYQINYGTTDTPNQSNGVPCTKAGDAALQAACGGFDSLGLHWTYGVMVA